MSGVKTVTGREAVIVNNNDPRQEYDELGMSM
jgi:hypothetical protein